MKTEEPDWIYHACLNKCTKHGINFNYIYKKMLEVNPVDEKELIGAMDDFIGWSFWNNYTTLLYPDDVDKKEELKIRKQKVESLN